MDPFIFKPLHSSSSSSNHYALLLTLAELDNAQQRQFRFENSWTPKPGFQVLVEKVRSNTTRFVPDLSACLGDLASSLSTWHKGTRSQFQAQVKRLERRKGGIQNLPRYVHSKYV